MVEAGSAAWIRTKPLAASDTPVDLQFLPNGVQRAVETRFEDLVAPHRTLECADLPGNRSAQAFGAWMLMPMPFLGRLDSDRKRCAGADPAHPDGPLRCDPVLSLADPGVTSQLPKLLAQQGAAPGAQELSALDTGELERLAWLDGATLEEGWLRIHSVEGEAFHPISARPRTRPCSRSRRACADRRSPGTASASG